LVNISRRSRSVPVGLLNVIYDGDYDLKYVFDMGNTYSAHEVQLRTRGTFAYGSVSLVLADKGQYLNAGTSLGVVKQLGFGFGVQPFFGPFFIDAGANVHATPEIENYDSKFHLDYYVMGLLYPGGYSTDLTIRIMPGWSFFDRKVGVCAGPGLTLFAEGHQDEPGGRPLKGWRMQVSAGVWINISSPEGRARFGEMMRQQKVDQEPEAAPDDVEGTGDPEKKKKEPKPSRTPMYDGG
jgi:hypothetical protein